MKKVAAILLLCIYSFAIMGFNLTEFYCCGKLKSISFTLVASQKNHCTDLNNDNDCCKTKIRFFKVNDGHFSPPVSATAFNHFIQITGCPGNPNNKLLATLVAASTSIHSPPLLPQVAIYKINCVYRI